MKLSEFKSPAFQFYPNDFLASAKVAAMTLEEVGLYVLLLAVDWNDGGLPDPPEKLSKLLRISPKTFRKLWRKVGENFTKHGGRYYNKRLVQERRKQLERKNKASAAANQRWHPDEDANALLPASVEQSPSISSSTSVAVAVPSTKHLSDAKGEQPAPRVALPREATDFLAQFYEPCLTEPQRERYRNVKQQLYEVLDPLHPGPKIRGGTRVKARSVQHFTDTLQAVRRDPPNDRDAAIVFFLKKLTDPVKGPSETELHKKAEGARISLEESYQSARAAAGEAWAKEHPDEAAKIVKAVEGQYAGREGAFVAVVKQSELAQRLSEKAQFPPFEKWLESRSAA